MLNAIAYTKRCLFIGAGVALLIFIANLLTFVFCDPASNCYRSFGYIPTLTAGYPWSYLLLEQFAEAHAILRIELLLLVALLINGVACGVALGIILHRFRTD